MKINGLFVHLKLFVKPLLFGILSALIWYRFFYLKIYFAEEDESAFTDCIIPTCFMFHALIAALVLTKVWDEYKMVRQCVRTKDRDSFRRCKDDRIPMAIHMLLGTLSFIGAVLVMLIYHREVLAGVASNFSVAFILTLYWEVSTNLDDPFRGVWYVGQVPPEWFKDEVHVSHRD
jgi:hypothetical protein